MKKSLPVSILLHALFLFIALTMGAGPGTKGHGKGKGDGEGTEGSRYKGANIPHNIIPKDRPTEVSIIETDPTIKGIKKKRPPEKKKHKKVVKDCKGPWYGGIGIMSNSYDGGGDKITEVFQGYPADLAGIKAGDIILQVEGDEILGQPGSIVHITTNRGEYFIARGKICY